MLDQLAKAYLIHQPRPGRWAMHDLLRAYAAERAARHDGETSRRDALTRLFDCYLATATAAVYLGDVGRLEGRYLEATGHLRQALVLFRAIADRAGQAEALNGLGEVALATGKSGRARAQHSAALDLASQIGELYEQARAQRGMAEAYLADGDSDQAREHLEQAMELYTRLGVPEADQLRDLFEPGVSSVPSAL